MGISQLDLQNLRHLIGQHETVEKKLRFYASQMQDSKLKNMFENSANEAVQTKQNLISYLQ